MHQQRHVAHVLSNPIANIKNHTNKEAQLSEDSADTVTPQVTVQTHTTTGDKVLVKQVAHAATFLAFTQAQNLSVTQSMLHALQHQ